MGPAKKIEQEEIDDLRGFEERLSEVVMEMGNVLGGLEDLKGRLDQLKQTRVQILQERNDYAKKLAEKYGDGSINLEKGEFTPVV